MKYLPILLLTSCLSFSAKYNILFDKTESIYYKINNTCSTAFQNSTNKQQFFQIDAICTTAQTDYLKIKDQLIIINKTKDDNQIPIIDNNINNIDNKLNRLKDL